MVNWNVTFANGEKMSGRNDNGSWGHVTNYMKTSLSPNTSLSISNEIGSASIDPNADGYFMGNKIISMLGSGQIHMVGIGYWKRHENVARIVWYDPDSLEPKV